MIAIGQIHKSATFLSFFLNPKTYLFGKYKGNNLSKLRYVIVTKAAASENEQR